MNATVKTVPITLVTLTKAFVLCQFQMGANGGNASQANLRVTCELTGPTTLTVTTGVADVTQTVRWYVVEFLSGVTVQSGLFTMPSVASPQTSNVAITNVNLAQSFALISERDTQAATNVDQRFTVRAQLQAANNLRLFRNDSGTDAVVVAWQVIEIDSAAVQSGLVTIPVNQTAITVTLNAALSPPVDIKRTFLVFSRSGGTVVGGEESLYQTTGEITNATTLTFTRNRQTGTANTQVDIAWFAVRMTDGTTVQSGSAANAVGAAGPQNAVIPTAITINKSIPILSTRGGVAGSVTDLDDTSWAGAFTTTTQLQLSKSPASSNTAAATVAWQVVQFNDKPNIIDGDGREIFP